MKNSDLISGVCWLVFGIILSIWSTNYKIGSLTQPGPGFMPLISGLLLIVLALLLLGKVKKSSLDRQKAAFFSNPGGSKKVIYTVLILLLLTFLFENIGRLLTFFLLLVSLMVVAELRSWKKIILVALFIVIGVYFVFVVLLEQPLPVGFLGI